jgi:hypothetical protein
VGFANFERASSGGGSLNVTFTEVTHVTRARVDLGTAADINNGAPEQLPTDTLVFNDIVGLSIGADTITLPAGSYELDIQINAESNSSRTNFYVDLRNGAAVLDRAYGPFYARGASNHDQTGATITFELTLGATTTINFATTQEASGGDVDLDGGWILIRRYEQKTVVETVALV